MSSALNIKQALHFIQYNIYMYDIEQTESVQTLRRKRREERKKIYRSALTKIPFLFEPETA